MHTPDVTVVENREMVQNVVERQVLVLDEEEALPQNGKSTAIVGVTIALALIMCFWFSMRLIFRCLKPEEIEKEDRQKEISAVKSKPKLIPIKRNSVDEIDAVIEAMRRTGEISMKETAGRFELEE